MNSSETVRKPYVAGQFYEAEPKRLSAEIERMLALAAAGDRVGAEADTVVRAMILPHAGYVYSGETAAMTAARARHFQYRRVVIIAPSHRSPIHGAALPGCQWYETPLGRIKVDTDAVNTLLAAANSLLMRHDDAHNFEHSLEVELPILQKLLPEFELLPIICGQFSTADAMALAQTLKPYWRPDTLWVISSDFTHYGRAFDYVPFTDHIRDHLRELDLGAVEQIKKLSPEAFARYVAETGATICGCHPITLLLAVIAAAGTKITPELVNYTTSGELTGDYLHCVSYVGMVFTG